MPASAARGGVIPAPADIVLRPGAFKIDSATVLRVPAGDGDAADAARYLAELWTRTNRLSLTVAAGTADAEAHSIVFRRRSGFAREAYAIEVTPQHITVSASSAAGLFYGAVTLWQLLPPGDGARDIPAQTLHDAPAYAWRGLMLDSARHFQSPAFVRSMIDWMAWHKLNVLHWHLTDDQGWRLEVHRYPRLTSVGAWRIDPGGARHGGFYSQDEVRDIVRFAARRHVQILPEIDMPGHATAAIAAYPFLGSPGEGTPSVSASWGILANHFNSQARTFSFLEGVLDEVMALFPGAPIHIGGDEVVGVPTALQAQFTARIGRYLAAHGRRMAGWDEILRPGLSKDTIIMSWHGVSGAHAAAMAGNDAVLTPAPTLYFDNRQSTLPGEPPGRLTVVSLEDVYRFEPRDATLSDGRQRHVLGVQANLWTEHIQTEARMQWMALPRAAALAEVGWSAAARRQWPDFLERLVSMFARYRAFGLHYADSVFAPAAAISRSSDGSPSTGGPRIADGPRSSDGSRGADRFSVTLSTQAQDAALGEIHYTLDGTEPSSGSPRYDTPLHVAPGAQLRAASFLGSAQASRTWAKHFDAHTGLRRDSHDLQLCSENIGLLLLPVAAVRSPLAIDIMNPCWIDRGIDLSGGPRMVAAVVPLPFNYEIGADAAKIRIGDARTAMGELEVHADGCDTPPLAVLPLPPAAHAVDGTTLPAQRLPALPGRHDLCLRFARPRLDPLWALDWIEIGE